MNIYADDQFPFLKNIAISYSLNPYKINCYRFGVTTNKLAAQSLPY